MESSLFLQTSTVSPTTTAGSAQVESAAAGEVSCSIAGPDEIFGNMTFHERLIQFYYQVETTASLSESLLNTGSTILPRLETAIANQLLPFLFRECRNDNRKLQSDTGACVAPGFSSLPTDIILSGGKINRSIALYCMQCVTWFRITTLIARFRPAYVYTYF